MKTDTIAAIATGMSNSGIGIVRISGDDALQVISRIYRNKKGEPKNLSQVKSHTIHYGYIYDGEERLDEVLVMIMKGPNSYTAEDTVEIDCHGGVFIVKKILETVIRNGARTAEPGEFTKRAFLNGRIDLTQAEAVIDVIRAKTEEAKKVATQQLQGRLLTKIEELRQKLIKTLAHIEVSIDYPEHDVEELTNQFLLQYAQEVHDELVDLLQTAKQGRILREGISTAIVGRPNVGKSSLLNALAQSQRAIVTDIPGTTRDVIEEYVNVRGIPLRLLDTAGIRETEDLVEQIGVEKSHEALQNADLILYMLNNQEPLSAEDEALIQLLQQLPVILIINKTDLEQRLDLGRLHDYFPSSPMVQMSIVKNEGIEKLEEAIAQRFMTGKMKRADGTYLTNARHVHLVQQAISALDDAVAALHAAMPIDLVQIDLQRAWQYLGEMIGKEVHEDLINQLFSQFCLGK